MNAAQQLLILGVRLYQLVLSPAKMFIFGGAGQCRFSPSCSQYALEAVKAHGAFKGSWLGLKRVCRCHPWGGCGCDPVPAAKFKVQSSKFKVVGPEPSSESVRRAVHSPESTVLRVVSSSASH